MTASRVAGWKERGRTAARAGLEPVVRLLVRTGVRPDVLTWLGLAITIGAGVLFGFGRFRLAAAAALVGTLMDAVDGAVARARSEESTWGAFLDSTTDRVADAALFGGIAAWYFYGAVRLLGDEDMLLAVLLGVGDERAQFLEVGFWHWLNGMMAVLALVGAFLVSYTRARAEGLGLECKVGWFERPERLIVLLGAGFFGEESSVMVWALLGLVALSFFTAFQRIAYVRARTGPGAAAGA